jgi:hypothetical protein
MYKTCVLFCAFLFVTNAFAGEKVVNAVGFESGKIQRKGGSVDAGLIRTLPAPQSGNEVIQTGSGGCGPTSNCDMRVVRSEFVDGQKVTPRAGSYFLRMMLDKSKDYTGLNEGKPKPRNSLTFRDDKYRFDHDVEEWIGFSVFLPKGYEEETETVGLILTEITTDSSAQFLKLSVGRRNGDKGSKWYFHHRKSDTSVSGSSEDVQVSLGSIELDKGKWTDFIIRVRSNPFEVDTNPAKKGIANAKDKLYEGNKGILQVWKAEGPTIDNQGNRKMVNKISIVNKPVGLVPGNTQGQDKMGWDARAYKGGWQGNAGQSTSVKGPIWIAWDEIRFGETARHGTTYSDVHPTGAACTDRCPDGSVGPGVIPAATPPEPPGNLRSETS